MSSTNWKRTAASGGAPARSPTAMADLTLTPPPSPSSRARRLVGIEVERCPYCQGTALRREGKRQKKHETVQLWYCRTCDRVFTPQRAKGKTYPLKVIL